MDDGGVCQPILQESLLLDKARCDAYREAIHRTVKPGDVVVDLGAGTGLLSFFALQAGARHVYAIEMSRIADVAAELIEANGFQRPHHADSQKFRKGAPAGTLRRPGHRDAQRFLLRRGKHYRARGRRPRALLEARPAHYTGIRGHISDAVLFGGLRRGPPPTPYYDLDFKPFSERLFKTCGLVRASGQPFVSLSQPAPFYHIDFRKDTRNPGKTFAPFRITAEGRLDGFLGWFEAHLCEGVTLSNSPYLPLTHWWQLYLPVLEQPHYHAGQTILLYLDPSIVAGEAAWNYAVQPAEADSRNPRLTLR